MKRYMMVAVEGHYGGIYTGELPSDNGTWVKYEDAARIIAQRDRLAEAIGRIAHIANEAADGYISNIANRALAELDKEKQS